MHGSELRNSLELFFGFHLILLSTVVNQPQSGAPLPFLVFGLAIQLVYLTFCVAERFFFFFFFLVFPNRTIQLTPGFYPTIFFFFFFFLQKYIQYRRSQTLRENSQDGYCNTFHKSLSLSSSLSMTFGQQAGRISATTSKCVFRPETPFGISQLHSISLTAADELELHPSYPHLFCYLL